jgi:hypothetical protein
MARTLIRLWQLRLFVALGLVLAAVVGVGSMKLLHKQVYASASTQLLVGAPSAAVGNAATDLSGAEALAPIYAQLLTSDQVLTSVGKAAGIPGNLIEAVGPLQVDGAPQTIRMPNAAPGEPTPTGKPQYILNLTQNPELPTIEVYTQAPTTKQAIALANAAGTGLTAFLTEQAASGATTKRVSVTQLGPATGGVVDPGAGKSIAVIAFAAVFLIWCGLLLWITRVATEIRTERQMLANGDGSTPEAATPPQPSVGTFRVRDTGSTVYTLVRAPEQSRAELRSAAAENGSLPERSEDTPRNPRP